MGLQSSVAECEKKGGEKSFLPAPSQYTSLLSGSLSAKNPSVLLLRDEMKSHHKGTVTATRTIAQELTVQSR